VSQYAAEQCREVKPLSGEQERVRYLSLEEVKRVMSVLIGDRAHFEDVVILDITMGG
jgi:hypothetical protein